MSRTVQVRTGVELEPEPAVALWRDIRRWPGFVEGLQRIEDQGADWPREGAKVVWVSGPGGRGTVTEKVISSTPTSFSTRVFEDRLRGTQTAAFEPREGGGSIIALSLEYELAGDNPFKAITDLIFIRRALRDSLGRTARRFAVEAVEHLQLSG